MRKGIIKDPTFSVYKKGGNVEKPMEAKGDGSAKKELMKLAKDEADLKFDFENAITDKIIRDFEKERSSGQSLSDWLNTKPIFAAITSLLILRIPIFKEFGSSVFSLEKNSNKLRLS